MVLRFYKNGPIAVRSDAVWVTRSGRYGCFVAENAGADIPNSAYFAFGHTKWHQYVWGNAGQSATAILPIEF